MFVFMWLQTVLDSALREWQITSTNKDLNSQLKNQLD